MIARFSLLPLLGLLLFAGTVPVRAGLLVSPGQNLVYDSRATHDDDVFGNFYIQSGYSGNFSFFGSPITTAGVSANGNLNFSSNGSFSNVPMPDSVARISPLWDDLVLQSGTGGFVSYRMGHDGGDGAFFAVTWNLNCKSDFLNGNNPGGPTTTFQVAMFGLPITINGFDFQPGDIAFSYLRLPTSFASGTATVGLDQGGGAFSALPGTYDGLVTRAQMSLLPTADDSFVLFRPDGLGGYDASINVVPEPSACALALCGGAGLLGLARRRRRATRRHL